MHFNFTVVSLHYISHIDYLEILNDISKVSDTT